MTRIVLVGCTKQKRSEPAPARDLYDPSQLFRARRAYAEASGCTWAVLSALHGVLLPGHIVEPYDRTMRETLRDPALLEAFAFWTLSGLSTLKGRALFGDLEIELHAGADYLEGLRRVALGGWGLSLAQLHHPLKGLGIGEQLAWYRARRDSG